MQFNPVELIVAKRQGKTLSSDAIRWLVDAYTNDGLPDYQMSAFLMASLLLGMDDTETAALTRAMLESGTILNLDSIPGVKVDKHSTGGVGDKVSLLLAPVVAACGVPVPMISGRGLMHSGGTLDKLEAIPGFDVNLTANKFVDEVRNLNMAFGAATPEIAPADRKMYALRDVTGTVECIPLIAGSIMSKKLAAGIDALVLDVKFGSGAFMKTQQDAECLAETLVSIGSEFGKPTVALLSEMDFHLGKGVGNWPETREAILGLHGEIEQGLKEVTIALAGEMIFLGREATSVEHGKERAVQALHDGSALDVLRNVVRYQGGDVTVVNDPDRYQNTSDSFDIFAQEHHQGFLHGLDAELVGWTAVKMGAGRTEKNQSVDPGAGLWFHVDRGDLISPGTKIATGYSKRTRDHAAFSEAILKALVLNKSAYQGKPRIRARFSDKGWERQ